MVSTCEHMSKVRPGRGHSHTSYSARLNDFLNLREKVLLVHCSGDARPCHGHSHMGYVAAVYRWGSLTPAGQGFKYLKFTHVLQCKYIATC